MSKRALLTGTNGNSLTAALSPEDLLQFLYYIHSVVGNQARLLRKTLFLNLAVTTGSLRTPVCPNLPSGGTATTPRSAQTYPNQVPFVSGPETSGLSHSGER